MPAHEKTPKARGPLAATTQIFSSADAAGALSLELNHKHMPVEADQTAEMMKVIHFDSAPEHVKKFAFAIMESLGPTGISDIAAKSPLIHGRFVGLRGDTCIDAVKWLVRYYESRTTVGPSEGRELAASIAKAFEEFALTLEAEMRANPPAPVLTIDGRKYL